MSKIVIVGPAYPYRGGIAAFSERLATEFITLGHEVVLYTFTLQYPEFLFPGKTQYSTSPAPENLLIRRTLNSIGPWSWIKTAKMLRREQADHIIYAFWLPYMGPALGTVARLASRPYKGHKPHQTGLLHNLIPHDKHYFNRQFARYFTGAMDRFTTMSKAVQADVRELAPSKFCNYSPHPLYDNFGEAVDREDACKVLGLNASDVNLLFFGLIRDYKGLDWLLQAFADPRLMKRDDIKLLVAGEFYYDGTKYPELARALGIEQKIVWKSEFVPDDQVKYWFGAADLVVQPYKTATQSGITQIAYHFVKPMLVTRVGGLAEVVPDGKAGYSVEPEVKAIADAICDFIERRPDFTEGLLEEKSRYSWEEMAKALIY